MRIPLVIIEKISEDPTRDHLYITNGGNVIQGLRQDVGEGRVSYDFEYESEEDGRGVAKYTEGDQIEAGDYIFIIEKQINNNWYEVSIKNNLGVEVFRDYYSQRDIDKW